MKKLLFSFIATGLVLSALAQTTPAPISYKKRPSLAVNFLLRDMKTPDAIGRSSIASVINNKQWTPINQMGYGVSVQYLQGLTDYIDFSGSFSAADVKYNFYRSSGLTNFNGSRFLLELDGAVNIKLLKDKYFLVPYMTFGLGASLYGGVHYAAHAPAGMGLQMNLGNGTFLNTNFLYKAAVSNAAVNNLTYSIGVVSPLKDKPEEPKVAPPPPPAPPVEKDTDGDGIVDSKDKCPTVAGTAKYDGCPVPDTDGDGINDENDKCPTVKGLAKYDGCPIPDTDKDGINDEEDKCPTVAGVARYQGCPVPDTDKDGVNDEEDKCPNVPGVKENNGCPLVKEEVVKKINTSAKNVFFVTGSAKLMTKSFKALDEVVAILKEDAALKLDIEGHTDATGSDKINLPLSKNRAKAVHDYLLSKGIEENRLTSEGYGSSKPVADNKTAKGRQLNRRVEMKLKYY
jgi:outer membrane protein OmpA-like peptidoglycan-associated protein